LCPVPFTPVQTTQRYWSADDASPVPSIGMQAAVMPGYFDVMGIPLRAGRDFTEAEIVHRRRAVAVDERLAARLWNGQFVGRRLAIGGTSKPLEVVGVTA